MISKERIETNQLLLELTDIDLTVKSLKDDIQAQKYYNVISNHIDNQLQSAIDWIDSNEAKEFFFNDAYHQGEIWDSLEEDWDTILSGEYDTIDDLLEEVYDYGKLRGYSNMAETLRYTPTDRLAFAFARNYNYGLIQNLDSDLRGAIKERMTRAAIQGENPYSLAPKLRELGLTQLPGSTFTPQQRAVLIARTETSRIQNTGILQSYVNEGYTQVKLLTAEDDNVCTICLKYAYEFNRNDKVTYENRGQELVHDIKDLIKGGEYPPFHPACYMPDTQVFTNKGWKYFYDLTDNDKILSLNPETNETEFLKPTKIIAHKNNYGYMYHIHNKWFDTCVTPDHDCFINQRREVKGKKVHVPEFRKPDELNSESYFVRTVENSNVSPETINVNGLAFKAEDYAFFMAWYLSEGNILHDEQTAKSKSYPIKITQIKNKNHEIIEPVFKKIANYLGIKLYIGEKYFEFHSKELYDYLKPLGYCYEMYVPDELFSLSKYDLNIFLDNYVLGDGHSRESNNKLVQNSFERTIVTSSINLVNGLSYITLLAGHYPSISLASKAGTVQEHLNGVYTQNHDVYCLRINRSKYAQFGNCTVDKVPYDGMVYCVELPKYHTLWVKRNGKTSWNGNCRCTYLSVWEGKTTPPDNPYTVDLTPQSYDNLSGLFNSTAYTGKPKNPEDRFQPLQERIFKQQIKGFVDDSDIEQMTKLLKTFINDIPDIHNEFGVANLFGNISVGFGDWENTVNPPYVVREFGLKYNIPILIHNHPYNSSPFPSAKDFAYYVKYGVHYGVVTNDLGTFIVKNNNINGNRNNDNDMRIQIAEIRENMVTTFKERYGHKYNNENMEDIKNISNMVNENKDKYLKMYQNVLNDFDMEIMFI